jgi:uncharacterized Fe-S radical SAM superfamily protein PflX
VDEAKLILEFLRNEIAADTYVNIMEQYRPTFKVKMLSFLNVPSKL